MFTTSILEVIIGVAFFYLLLSMICSVIKEGVSRVFSLRSDKLKEAIRKLVADPTKAASLLNHPLIKGLSSSGMPDHIPSRTFALVLQDVVAPAGATVKTATEVRTTINALPEVELKKALLALMDSAGDDLKKFQENVEHWFDHAMSELSSTYKELSQWIIFVIALVAVVIMNADTFEMANALSTNASLRASLVTSAEKMAKSEKLPEKISYPDLKKEFDDLKLPLGWDPGKWKWEAVPILAKAGGLLVTVFAVCLGAPFWFDALKKILSIRKG